MARSDDPSAAGVPALSLPAGERDRVVDLLTRQYAEDRLTDAGRSAGIPARATLEPGVTEIDVRAFMGCVQIRLPAEVRVMSDGHGRFGFFAARGTGGENPDSLRVVHITGRTVFGFAESFVQRGVVGSADAAPRLEPGERA